MPAQMTTRLARDTQRTALEIIFELGSSPIQLPEFCRADLHLFVLFFPFHNVSSAARGFALLNAGARHERIRGMLR